MKKILSLMGILALVSCAQQNVVAPHLAVPAASLQASSVPATPVKAAVPVARTKKMAAPKPDSVSPAKATPASQPKPVAPAAEPLPLKPLRGTHSTLIQESDRVQSARSMGGSATYAH